jgi:hypothetical protein
MNFDIACIHENLSRKSNFLKKIGQKYQALYTKALSTFCASGNDTCTHNNTENNNTKERALFVYHGNAFNINVTAQTLLRHIGNNCKYRSLWGTNFVFIKCVSIHVKNAELLRHVRPSVLLSAFKFSLPPTDSNKRSYELLLFHGNEGCRNAPQCYVTRTLSILF